MQSYHVFDAALKTPQPYESLREVVKGRLGEGADREDLRVELEEFRVQIRRQRREADDDIVLEVLDDLTGWTSPHKKL